MALQLIKAIPLEFATTDTTFKLYGQSPYKKETRNGIEEGTAFRVGSEAICTQLKISVPNVPPFNISEKALIEGSARVSFDEAVLTPYVGGTEAFRTIEYSVKATNVHLVEGSKTPTATLKA